MSMSLYWLPVIHRDGKHLPDALKFALRKRHNGHVDIVLTESSIGYLQGLSDAGVDGAETLIEALEVHGEIRVFEE